MSTSRSIPKREVSAQNMLRSLLDGLAGAERVAERCEIVEVADLPALSRELLVHNEHMTTRLLDHHGAPVRLDVLQEELAGATYRREIVLRRADDGRPVEYGVVRMDLRALPPAAREAVLNKTVPLGDVLVSHDVLRSIEPRWFLRVNAEGRIAAKLAVTEPAFGRLGVIHCNGYEAIELLEVVPQDAPQTDSLTTGRRPPAKRKGHR